MSPEKRNMTVIDLFLLGDDKDFKFLQEHLKTRLCQQEMQRTNDKRSLNLEERRLQLEAQKLINEEQRR